MKYLANCAVLVVCQVSLAVAQPAGLKETAVSMSGKTISVKYTAVAASGQSAAIPAVFHTDADLEVQGLAVPKGDYALLVQPDAKEWKLIVSKPAKAPGTASNAKLEVGRVAMDMKKGATPADTLRMTLTSFGKVAGKLELAMGSTIASVAFNLDVVKSAPEW
jgi:hypothetical protein